MKKIVLCLIILIAFSIKDILAVSPTITKKPVVISSSISPAKSKTVQNLITRAQNQIENRIDALQKILTKMDSNKKLIDSDKSLFKSEANSLISELEALKTKISKSETVQGTRDEYKSVLGKKVYAYFIPKARLNVSFSNLLALTEDFENSVTEVEKLSTNLKSYGRDTQVLERDLKVLEDRLAGIKKILSDDKAKITSLTLSSDYKTTFVAVRKDFAKVRSEFAKVRKDTAIVRKDLKDLDVKSSNKPSAKL